MNALQLRHQPMTVVPPGGPVPHRQRTGKTGEMTLRQTTQTIWRSASCYHAKPVEMTPRKCMANAQKRPEAKNRSPTECSCQGHWRFPDDQCRWAKSAKDIHIGTHAQRRSSSCDADIKFGGSEYWRGVTEVKLTSQRYQATELCLISTPINQSVHLATGIIKTPR